MRVQSIGKNNYNYQTNQNSKNTPAFKQNIIGWVHFKEGAKIPEFLLADVSKFLLPNHLREAFKRFAAGNKFIAESDIFANRAFAAQIGDGSTVSILVVDKASDYAKQALKKLPEGTEEKCMEYYNACAKAGEAVSTDLSSPPEYANYRRACTAFIADVCNNDPKTIRFNIDAESLEFISKTPQNLPNEEGKVWIVPLRFEF